MAVFTIFISLDPWPLVTKAVNFNAALNRKVTIFTNSGSIGVKLITISNPDTGYHLFSISICNMCN